MRIKKTVATFVAATMLFGSVGSAFAATVDDSSNRLVALGLVTGYEDGSIKPDQPITRAEYAAIAVRALGLDAAATLAKGTTKFKDVPASHWASGYVNLAVDQGIINGYPDGTFKPSANVTYAEAIAMMVRVLGYEPTLTGSWPTKYISKASTIGLLTDVAIDNFNAASPRGAVFQVADNALVAPVMKQTGYGANVSYAQDSVNVLLTAKLGVTKASVAETVYSVPATGAGAGKIVINAPGATAKEVIGTVDLNALFGEKVVVWEKDGKVVHVKSESKVVRGTIEDVKAAVAPANEKIKVGGVEYEVATAGLAAITNYNAVTPVAYAKGQEVKLILDANSKVTAIYNNSYDSGVVKSVNADTRVITVFSNGGTTAKTALKDKNYTVVKDGKAATLADIKEGDVVNILSSQQQDFVYVSSTVVTGDITTSTATSVTVGGTKYDLATGALLSNDGATSFVTATQSGLQALKGSVTVYLNKEGKAVAVSTPKAAAVTGTPVILAGVTKVAPVFPATKAKVYVEVYKIADATKTVYEVSTDEGHVVESSLADAEFSTTDAITADSVMSAGVVIGGIVDVKLTADGKVEKFIAHTTFKKNTTAIATVNESNKRMTVEGVTYTVDTAKFYAWDAATNSFKVVTFADVANAAKTNNSTTPQFAQNAVRYVVSGTTLTEVIIDQAITAAPTAPTQAVIVSSAWNNTKGAYEVVLNEKGTATTYEVASGVTIPAAKKFVTYSLTSGKVSALTEVASTGTKYKVKSVGTNVLVVNTYSGTTLGTTDSNLFLDANVVVYDLSVDNAVSVKTVADLAAKNIEFVAPAANEDIKVVFIVK